MASTPGTRARRASVDKLAPSLPPMGMSSNAGPTIATPAGPVPAPLAATNADVGLGGAIPAVVSAVVDRADQVGTLVMYYVRQGMHTHAGRACVDGVRAHLDEPTMSFWKSFAMLFEGRITEAIRELQGIQGKLGVRMQATAALLYAHNQCTDTDGEAISSLSAQLEEFTKSASFKSVTDAAYFFLYTKQYDKARDMVKKAESMQPGSVQGLVIHGWVDLLCGREAIANKSHRFFDEALAKSSSPDLEALLGLAKYMDMNKKYTQALDYLNKAIALHTWFAPALLEKARVLIAMDDWDQAMETLRRIMAKEPQNTEALQLIIMQLLCREGNYQAAVTKISDLTSALDRLESQNAALYHTCGKAFSRIAGRSAIVLKAAQVLIERAISLQPKNSDFITEAGHIQYLQGNFTNGLTQFKAALKLNESNIEAMYGLIKCQLYLKNVSEAEKQIEFLLEIQSSLDTSVELTYITGLLKWIKSTDMEESARLFTSAVDLHFKTLCNIPPGMDFFVKFNADMLLDIAKQYLQHYADEPLDAAAPIPPVMKKATELLEIVSKTIPGQLECLYLLAKTRYIMNDLESAQSSLDQCLRLDPSYADGFLLLSQLHLAHGLFKQALQAVGDAFTREFNMRSNSLYYLLRAKAHFGMGSVMEAIKDCNNGLDLPGIRKPMPADTTKITLQGREFVLAPHTTVSLYIQLANCYAANSQLPLANQTLTQCLEAFRGTAEEIRIIIAQSDLLAKNGDTTGALTLLGRVDESNVYYIRAQCVMANIYLVHNNDRVNYIHCFERLTALPTKSTHSLLLLADAFTRVQEIERAIETYQRALALCPEDQDIAIKLGKAYVATHDFEQAIKYYRSALHSDSASASTPTVSNSTINTQLRYDLAELLAKLHRFSEAESVVADITGRSKGVSCSDLSNAGKFQLLLAQVHSAAGMADRTIEDLIKAKELHTTLLNKMKNEQPDQVNATKAILSDIYVKIADHFTSINDQLHAQSNYLEALQHNEGNKQAMISLAKLYFTRNNSGDVDLCYQQCIAILRDDPTNEEASLIMADLMERKGDLVGASRHLQQILEGKQDNLSALERLVLLLQRGGKLDELPPIFTSTASKLHSPNAGLPYCKGLYYRFTKHIPEAVEQFNMARHDPEWGIKAKMNMIQLYLGEEGDMFMDEDRPGGESSASSIASAKELMRELPETFQQSIDFRVMENMCLILTRNKSLCEQANTALTKIVGPEEAPPAHLGALIALAIGHMALKQAPKARNQLRRLTKIPITNENLGRLERGHVLLAHLCIQNGKNEQALEYIEKCLEVNRSCSKAYELYGLIKEKEGLHKEAADKYVVAWNISRRTDLTVGYKLAFNYLKAKKYLESIDVCNRILQLNDKYPKIKREILDKARTTLRL
ncbi:tetratricopeptide repeat protein 21B [Pelomyxa schiedti]|nr:tetratricopeptide repeat protein 21B [Pelomyxa schiedti]